MLKLAAKTANLSDCSTILSNIRKKSLKIVSFVCSRVILVIVETFVRAVDHVEFVQNSDAQWDIPRFVCFCDPK